MSKRPPNPGTMSNEKWFAMLAMSHPYRVHVKNFLSRNRAGEFPRRDEIWGGKATSIVRYRNASPADDGGPDNTTTFCFDTEEELNAFKKEYNL